MSRRAQWRAAVSAAPFSTGMRPVKATLLSLPIDVDGTLTAWREQIAETTGLPLRTIDRHLARACDAGWLRHDAHGGHGRRARYNVQLPSEVARHVWQTNTRVARHVVRATTSSCAPRGGELLKNYANVSEHVAVNERRRDVDHERKLRVLPDDEEDQERAEGRAPAVIRLADIPPDQRVRYAYTQRSTAARPSAADRWCPPWGRDTRVTGAKDPAPLFFQRSSGGLALALTRPAPTVTLRKFSGG